MDRSKTPRSLIRFMQSDSTRDAKPEREARDLVRAFISADEASSGSQKSGETVGPNLKADESRVMDPELIDDDVLHRTTSQPLHSDSISQSPSHDRPPSAISRTGKVNRGFMRRVLSSRESVPSPVVFSRKTVPTPFTSVELCVTCINVTLLTGVLAISTFLLGYFYLLHHTLSTHVSL